MGLEQYWIETCPETNSGSVIQNNCCRISILTEALIRFDEDLKKEHPEIYRANINRAVKALRKSNYLLYRPACAAVREKYGRKI